MNNITEILENASKEELNKLLSLIPKEIQRRIYAEKEALKEQTLLLYKEVNSLGRNIYTIKEITEILKTKEYIVADIIKKYKNNLKDV